LRSLLLAACHILLDETPNSFRQELGSHCSPPDRVSLESPSPNQGEIDWIGFKSYLLQRVNAKTAGDTLRYAKQYASILQPFGMLNTLLQLPPDKRIHVMKALASLSRFTGTYDNWMQIRQRYRLTWTTGNETLTALSRFFDDNKSMDNMLE
jgi:hypothetical protein